MINEDQSVCIFFLYLLFEQTCTYPKSIIEEKAMKLVQTLTIKPPERRHWGRSGVCIVNIEHISHFSLVFFYQFHFVVTFAEPQNIL